MTSVKTMLVLAIALAACSAPMTDEPPDSDGFDLDESPTVGFDLELVKMAIVAECEVEPVLFDEETCTQLNAEQVTADGMALQVPTSLEAEDAERAEVICDQIAEMRFTGESSQDVGFETVQVLDSSGAPTAECKSAH